MNPESIQTKPRQGRRPLRLSAAVALSLALVAGQSSRPAQAQIAVTDVVQNEKSKTSLIESLRGLLASMRQVQSLQRRAQQIRRSGLARGELTDPGELLGDLQLITGTVIKVTSQFEQVFPEGSQAQVSTAELNTLARGWHTELRGAARLGARVKSTTWRLKRQSERVHDILTRSEDPIRKGSRTLRVIDGFGGLLEQALGSDFAGVRDEFSNITDGDETKRGSHVANSQALVEMTDVLHRDVSNANDALAANVRMTGAMISAEASEEEAAAKRDREFFGERPAAEVVEIDAPELGR